MSGSLRLFVFMHAPARVYICVGGGELEAEDGTERELSGEADQSKQKEGQ